MKEWDTDGPKAAPVLLVEDSLHKVEAGQPLTLPVSKNRQFLVRHKSDDIGGFDCSSFCRPGI